MCSVVNSTIVSFLNFCKLFDQRRLFFAVPEVAVSSYMTCAVIKATATSNKHNFVYSEVDVNIVKLHVVSG